MRQLWHTNKDNLSLESNGETIDTEQLCSNYYGQTTKCRQIEFQTKNSSIKQSFNLYKMKVLYFHQHFTIPTQAGDTFL